MKMLLKILLFPITFILSIVVHISCFLVEKIGGLLNILSFFFFLGGLIMFGFALFYKNGTYYWQPAIFITVLSFIISPYGIPKLAALLVCKIDELNDLIKSI